MFSTDSTFIRASKYSKKYLLCHKNQVFLLHHPKNKEKKKKKFSRAYSFNFNNFNNFLFMSTFSPFKLRITVIYFFMFASLPSIIDLQVLLHGFSCESTLHQSILLRAKQKRRQKFFLKTFFNYTFLVTNDPQFTPNIFDPQTFPTDCFTLGAKT